MKITFTLLAFVILLSVQAQETYLHCGSILDTEKGEFLQEQTIIISENKIDRIEDGYIEAAHGVQSIDLKDKFILPGLIDLHVHIEHETNPNRYLERFTLNEADIAFISTALARKTLMAGFTTVRDLGGSGVNIALKNAINKGIVEGPRIFTSGKSLATTGGHADPTNGMKNTLKGDPGPKEGVVNSIEDAKKAVRERYKNGADCIKITATGGVLSVANSGQNPQFMIDEIKAITETAKDYNFLVAAHAHGDEGMRRAILGGVTTIEHGSLMSDSTMELMAEMGTYLVPTITAGKEVAANAEIPGYFPKVVAIKAKAIGPKIQETFAKAYKAGVPIAFGTDAGVFPHGENAREFVYMVEAGMPPIEAIQSATITAAKIVQQSDQLGQLKAGFLADIIAVDSNPIEDISTLKDIQFVMKNGVVYKAN